MSHIIQKITWLLCVTALTIAFKEPVYLTLLLFLPLVGRKKEINKSKRRKASNRKAVTDEAIRI